MYPTQTTENPIAGSINSKILLQGDLLYLKVGSLKAKKTKNNLLVESEIINTTNNDDVLFYRFRWYDKNGYEINNQEESWKTIPFRGMQIQNIRGVSPTDNTIDFKLELHSPNNLGKHLW